MIKILRYSLLKFSLCLFISHSVYFSGSAYAQFSKLKFDYLTVDDGLPANGTHCMFRDSKGYLWVGTQQGLCRYDGIKVKVYKYSGNDNRSLSHDEVFCIFEDSQFNLWIGTVHGLNLLDRKTETFTRFVSDPINNRTLSDNFITNLLEDKKGNLWVNTHNGINKWAPKSQTFERHSVPGKVNRTRPFYADHVSFDSKGNIWGARGEKLWCFNTRTVQFETYWDKSVGTAFREETIVKVDSANTVWIGTRTNGLFAFYPSTKTFYNYNTTGDGTGTNSSIIADLQIVDQSIVMATEPGGIDRLNTLTHKVDYCLPNEELVGGLNASQLWSLYVDNEGIIYAGGLNGVNIHNPKKNKFKSFAHSSVTSNCLVNNMVYCLFEDSKGLIWIGTSKGVSVFDPKKQTFTNYTHNPSNIYSISGSRIICFAEDKKGDIWIGTSEAGLNKFERRTGKFYHHYSNINGTTFSSGSYILDMCRMPDETIWLSLYPKGIGILDIDKGIITIYESNVYDKINNLDTWIDRFVKLPNSELAFITPKGLGIYNFDKDTFYMEQSVKGIHTMDVCVNNYGTYIATHNNGFWEIPLKGKPTKYLLSKLDSIAPALGLLNDKNGNIWISTAEDLQRFNIKTKTTVHFSDFEGLQKWYSGYARLKASDGTFYFGGTKGISLFNPDEISINTYLPTVIINEFQIFNQLVTHTSPHSPLKNEIDETKELTLSYKDAVFSFGFIAINFTYHQKTKYAYKLDGYDKEWNYTDENRRYASYSNITPGNYTFLVKASNNDGVWNEQATILKITITPPWWKTWWFRALFAFGTIGLLQVVYLYRVKTLTKRQLLLEHKVRIRTLQLKDAIFTLELRQKEILEQNIVLEAGSEKIKEMEMLKTRFFIHISHEFRTPLTLILGPIESMIVDFKKNEWMGPASKLELINRNAKRLLNLVNQLIDIHKIGSGSMRLKVSPTPIGVFVNQIAELFMQLAIERDINFLLPSNTNPIEVYIDVEKMEKVIFNLLSNAFKYNKPNGTIEITIEEDQTHVTIQIRDTGIGINKESLPYVFEHFYQAINAQSTMEESSGIGLSLCKSLVEMHHGTINLQSIENEGSTFIVTLPLGKSHFKPEEIVEIKNDQLPLTDEQLQIASLPRIMDNQHLTTILIVDDNTDMRTYIKSELIGEYQIIEASEGVDGFEKAVEHNPGLIISDVMMPVTDGIELCNNLKNNELTSHIPVILLTAKNTEESAIEGFNSGADDYITKPFSAILLRSRIKNILHTRELLRQNYARQLKVEPKAITLNPTDEKFMAKILAMVEKNIANPDFTVTVLANEMCMSYRNLHRKITAITGSNGSAFISSARMKMSAKLLTETNLSVSEIALKLGFTDPKSFSTHFKKWIGKSPSQFRQRPIID